MTDHELERKAIALRRTMLQGIFSAGAGHTGGGLSCMDILNVLYNRVLNVSPETLDDRTATATCRARAIGSRRCTACSPTAAFSRRRIWRPFAAINRTTSAIPRGTFRGIEMNTGALGHGLPICVGMALAGKMDDAPYRVFTLLGDGELAEGSNWEAALAAAHYKLDNLTAILDHNTLQITGHTRDVM